MFDFKLCYYFTSFVQNGQTFARFSIHSWQNLQRFLLLEHKNIKNARGPSKNPPIIPEASPNPLAFAALIPISTPNNGQNKYIFKSPFFFSEQKKRHIPKMCPSLRLVQRCNTHKTGMCHAIMHGHTDSKSVLQYAFFLKYQFRDGRLQSVCQIFYSVIVFVC